MYKTIWVMEDDIEVIKDPLIISDLIRKLDDTVGVEGWDILFTDKDTKDQNGNYIICRSTAPRPNFSPSNTDKYRLEPEVINKFFKKIFTRYGAYSMIIRRSGMKKILDFIKKYHVFLPYDLEFPIVPNIQMYCVTEDVVSTRINAESDNASQGYK